MSTTGFVIEKDNDGTLVLSRERLRAPTATVDNGFAGVTVGPNTQHVQIARVSGEGKRQYLQRLEAVCIATGATGGILNLYAATGMTTPLKTFVIPGSQNPGARFAWDFPTPVYSPTSLHMQSIPSQLGSFFVTVDGFYSAVPQVGG